MATKAILEAEARVMLEPRHQACYRPIKDNMFTDEDHEAVNIKIVIAVNRWVWINGGYGSPKSIEYLATIP
jgi:hypothetical protein